MASFIEAKSSAWANTPVAETPKTITKTHFTFFITAILGQNYAINPFQKIKIDAICSPFLGQVPA
jgi:hypothetical protein